MAHQPADKYKLSYYTGTQASIWVKNIWVEEVFGIHFQATQNIIPIFGYASAFFNAVARGKVLVQGTFEINFIDEGYLYYILHKTNADKTKDPESDNKEIKESAAKIEGGEPQAESEVAERLQDLRITAAGKALAGDTATALSEIMEFLAVTNVDGATKLSREMKNIRSGTDRGAPRSIIYDMVSFDMMGVFGNPDIAKEAATNKKLLNCFLVSNEMIVGVDDQVVKERYSFIGQQHQ